jgi:hypothetical protein
MAEVLLISENYIKKYTTVNGSVDPNLLYPSVYLAQDKWLQAWLGTNLLNELKQQVADENILPDYQVLLTDYVQKCLLWWVMVEVTPMLCYRMDNGTLVQRQSEDTIPITDAVMKDMIDRARQNAEHYSSLLVDYLCANSALFPEYTSAQWPQRSPRVDVTNSLNYQFSSGNTATSFRPAYSQNILNRIP